MQDGAVFNSQTIIKLGHDIIDGAVKLGQMLDQVGTIVAESKSVYDSESATEFRKKMEEFKENTKRGAGDSLNALAEYFEAVAKKYEKDEQDLKGLENQYLSTDLFKA